MRKVILLELAVLLCVGMVGLFVLSVSYTKPAEVVFLPMETEDALVSFPYTIPGTNLVALHFAVYDGPFYEDGTGEEVFGVTALVIQNKGEHMVERGTVFLESEEGSGYFCFTSLPAGASILVPEQNRAKTRPESILRCTGEVSVCETALPWDHLEITHTDSITLAVSNKDTVTYENICISYKDYDTPSRLYIGGETMSVTIAELRPGQTVTVSPYRYVEGYSSIVAVKSSQ